MSQALALAVLAGLVSAGLALLPLSGSVGLIFFGYFVQLPLMLVGLTMGFAACLVAIVAALLINALIGGPSVAVIFAVAFALPSIIVVRQALLSRTDNGTTEWYPPGFVLAWLTVAAALGVVVAFAMFMGRDGGLLGLIDQSLTEAISQLSSGDGQAVPIPDLTAIRDRIWMIPAAVASSWLIMAVLNGIIAQSLAVRSGWNRRPSPNFSSLDLPVWLWPLMGIAAMLALVGGSGDLGSLGRTALIVLVTPFAFLGLAVIHKFANRWSHRQLGLAAIYAGIVVFNWPILAVVALGLVEDWAHLRRYM